MQITIDVRGSAATRIDPERAVVHAEVTADGPDPDPVRAQVTGTVAELRTALDGLQRSGAVVTFSIDQIRTGQHRPWNDRGEQLPPVHTAAVSVSAQFADFRALGRWAFTPGLSVHHVDWRLTEATHREVARRTRQEAVRDAATRAQDYADALGCGPVHPHSVRDPGVTPEPRGPLMARAAMAEDSGVDIVPRPIEVVEEVHATFTALSGVASASPHREDNA